jgi:hypothetical protein
LFLFKALLESSLARQNHSHPGYLFRSDASHHEHY